MVERRYREFLELHRRVALISCAASTARGKEAIPDLGSRYPIFSARSGNILKFYQILLLHTSITTNDHFLSRNLWKFIDLQKNLQIDS